MFDHHGVQELVKRAQASGSPAAMEAAASAERESEKATLEQYRADGTDGEHRAALEEAYPKRTAAKRSPAKRSGGKGTKGTKGTARKS